MARILRFLIKAYWLIIPPAKRNRCLFNESCSRIVYRVSLEKGLFPALRIFWFRYNNCRSDYHLFLHNNQIYLRTIKNNIVDHNEINPDILRNKKS